MKARDIVLCALLGALLLVAQVALAVLPNIELVSLLVILYTQLFKKKALAAIYLFALLEGLVYGFGVWWIVYLYVWPVLALIAYLFRRNTSVLMWAVISGIFGLCFGAMCAIPYFIIGGIYGGFSYFIAGIPFDLLHCGGNIVVMLLLYRPLRAALEKLDALFYPQKKEQISKLP